MLLLTLVNNLNYTHPTAIATEKFNTINAAMGDTEQYDLDGILVRRTRGLVANLFIQSPIGNIDLSQDPTGELVDGIIHPRLETPHDDEREFVLGRPRQFPLTEGDLQFIDGLVKAIRVSSTDQHS